MENTIYVRSLGKTIPITEFESYLPKIGHVYSLNNHYFHKYVGKDDNGQYVVESVAILNNVNDGDYQMILNPNAVALPSLDFVNMVICGEIKEVDVKYYDKIVAILKETSILLDTMVEKLVK